MMEMIEFTIICALLLWTWYSGGFSNKSQIPVVIPVPKCYSGCVCYSIVNQPVTEKFVPVVLTAVHEDIDGDNTEENIPSDNDRLLTPETLPQPLPYPEAAIAADILDQKIIADATHQPGGLENLIETDELGTTEPDDADLKVAGDSPPHEIETMLHFNPDNNNDIDQSWKPAPLPSAETDEPDVSVDDLDEEFIIPPDFFVDPNRTDPETVPVEVLMTLSHPQQPDAQVEINNNQKILDEADKPDESDEDSYDDEIKPPQHFFVDAKILNPTEPDDSDGEIEMDTEEEYVIPGFVPPLEADLPQVTSSTGQEDWDAIVPENPLPESYYPKRFIFKVTKLPYLPDDFYVTLHLNERDNDGKIRQTKILSSWSSQKPFSMDVHNTEDATVICKLKRKALPGLQTLTDDVKEIQLVNNGSEIQLLTGFKVAVIRSYVIEPFDIKKRKRELAKEKKEERKLKERLAFCKKNGIDPYVRIGSDETYGLGQQQKEKKIPEIKTKKKPSFWVKYGFLYPEDRYTRRRFEY